MAHNQETLYGRRLVSENSLFYEFENRRKTHQPLKDFFNDQDSVVGPNLVDVMLKNILSIRKNTLGEEEPNEIIQKFGICSDEIMFEQLDWATLDFARSQIFYALGDNLPENIVITNVDVRPLATLDGLEDAASKSVSNTLGIDISFYVKDDLASVFDAVKSDRINGVSKPQTRRFSFTMGINSRNEIKKSIEEQSPNKVQFRTTEIF